jgi:hypothetical protein
MTPGSVGAKGSSPLSSTPLAWGRPPDRTLRWARSVVRSRLRRGFVLRPIHSSGYQVLLAASQVKASWAALWLGRGSVPRDRDGSGRGCGGGLPPAAVECAGPAVELAGQPARSDAVDAGCGRHSRLAPDPAGAGVTESVTGSSRSRPASDCCTRSSGARHRLRRAGSPIS